MADLELFAYVRNLYVIFYPYNKIDTGVAAAEDAEGGASVLNVREVDNALNDGERLTHL